MDILFLPIMTYLILSIGCIGALTFLFNPKKKMFGLLSGISFIVYFTSHMIAGYTQAWMIFITFIGVVLLVLEAFIPSFGTLGLLGLISVGAGIIKSSQSVEVGISTLGICFIVSFITVIILIKKYGMHPIFRKLMLTDTLGQSNVDQIKATLYEGLNGIALTPLRPSGVAIFNQQQVDVLTEGGYIASETKVKIVKIAGNKVIVREL